MESTAPASSQKKHIKLVIIGRTGAGKTTFINSATNQFYKVNYDEERIIAIDQEQTLTEAKTGKEMKVKLKSNIQQFQNKQSDAGGSQSVSQTTKANIYDLEDESYKLTLIDTPGLGDTGGIETDKQHCKNISSAVAALSDFNAIVLVHKANDCRNDAMLCYLINEFKSMLPKECEKNFLVCFTSAVNSTKIDAINALQQLGLKCESGSYFGFENDCLTPVNLVLKALGYEYPFQNEEEAERAKEDICLAQGYWKKNARAFQDFLKKADSLTPLPGKSLAEIANKKDILIETVHVHSDDIVKLQEEKKRVNAQLQRITTINNEISSNKDYLISDTQLVKKTRYRKEQKLQEVQLPNGQKSTQCMLCKNICHEDCSLDQVYSEGHIALLKCMAFEESTGSCLHCSHHYAVHKHSTTIMQTIQVDVPYDDWVSEPTTRTDHSKLQRYEDAKRTHVEIERDIESLKKQVADKENKIQTAYRWIAHLHKELAKTTIGSNSEYFRQYLDYLKKLVQENPKLSDRERDAELKDLQKAEKDYEAIKQALENTKDSESQLTDSDKQGIEAKVKAAEKKQQEIVQMYQGDRRNHHVSEFKRKKSIVWTNIKDNTA